MKSTSILICALLLCPVLLYAQAPEQSGPEQKKEEARQASESGPFRIELLTVLPGKEIYNAWGHTALRLTSRRDGQSLVFDYGTFTFDRYFVLRFLSGDPVYYLAVRTYEQTQAYYEKQKRAIYAQEIYLPPQKAQELAAFLQNNMRPENRAYRYDHYLNNCTTIYRDLLDRLLGGDPGEFWSRPGGTTFRKESLAYVQRMPFFHFGIDLIINGRADRAISFKEAQFVPQLLLQGLEEYRLANRPQSHLIGEVKTLYAPDEAVVFDSGSPARIIYLSIFVVIFLLPLLLHSEVFQRISLRIWIVMASAFSVLLLSLWVLNSDGFFQHNANLFFFHPFWPFFVYLRRKFQQISGRGWWADLLFLAPTLLVTILYVLDIIVEQSIGTFSMMSLFAQLCLAAQGASGSGPASRNRESPGS
ncbi:MAG: DUF4105 domain-containing protein [Spirochaetales bacterium]|nr:DUF4105 domain-containing protein [Spirochaetales bacterium]